VKEVTFKGTGDDEQTLGFVQTEGISYPVNQAVTVSNDEAAAIQKAFPDYKFDVKDAPAGAKRTNPNPASGDGGSHEGTGVTAANS
jgi:hypothetical protein